MSWVEFYPEKQGHPESKVALDMDRRGPSIPANYIKVGMLLGGDDYVKTADLNIIVDKLTANSEALATLVEQLRIELVQVKLHLASMSDEDIDERDVDV